LGKLRWNHTTSFKVGVQRQDCAISLFLGGGTGYPTGASYWKRIAPHWGRKFQVSVKRGAHTQTFPEGLTHLSWEVPKNGDFKPDGVCRV